MKKCKRLLAACLGAVVVSTAFPTITNAKINIYEDKVSGGMVLCQDLVQVKMRFSSS